MQLSQIMRGKCNVVDGKDFLRKDVGYWFPSNGRKEVSGVQYSDDAIFHSANFIITPTEQNTEKGIAFERIGRAVGVSSYCNYYSVEHDK
ncbi:MAG: hypothetical protein ACLSCV_05175 [Acutalibacteraceae bacterium]